MARGRAQRRSNSRDYPRTARVNELCHEIVAEELELIDDERLELVTVTHVGVDPDFARAVVDFTTLGDEAAAKEGLQDHRVRLQNAIGRQARLKRTPELRFRVDEVVTTGVRIEEILHRLGVSHEGAHNGAPLEGDAGVDGEERRPGDQTDPGDG